MMSNCLNAHEIHTIILDQFDDHRNNHQLSHLQSTNQQQHNYDANEHHLDNGKTMIKYEDVEDQLPRIQYFKKSLITSSTSPPLSNQLLINHQQQQQQQHFRVIKDGRLLYDDDNGHHGVTSSGIKGSHIDCNNEYQMRPPPNPPPKVTKIISTNEEPTSSIPDLEFDGTTVLCRVCGDKASGFHYGVHSCEGCKGFFRRSIQQKIQYRPCTKNQQCSILRINRNRCQYCRLKKCIAVGMSRDAVRFGRVPKREKARILAAMQQSTQNRGQQRALATELDDQPRLLAAVLRAHMDTCEFTREKVNQMRQRARECPTYSMPTLACPLNPAPEIQSEQEFSQRFAHVIRGVIDFAGMIPGFQLLTQDDKFTLLKAGLFDALFVRLICMFDTNINSIICLNGQLMRRDSIQNGANARFLVDSTFNFAERINSMNLTDSEIGLFCAIVLITPDRPGLRNVELIERMYKKLKMCLHAVVQQNRPEKPEFMQELLSTMPDLRTLSTLHTEKLVVFRTEHKELLRQNMWSSVVHDMEGQQASTTSTTSTTTTTTDDHSTQIIDDIAKSPMSSVSSTESNDTNVGNNNDYNNGFNHHRFVMQQQQQQQQQQSSITSSAPLLAATLSGYTPAVGVCPMRNHSTVTATNSSQQQHQQQQHQQQQPAQYIHHRTSNSSAEDDLQQVQQQQQQQQPPPPPQAAVHLVPNGLTITPVLRQMPAVPSVRKLESPTDSGIESGNEKQTEQAAAKMAIPAGFSSGSSSCSSPRSSLDDGTSLMDHHAAMHHHFASQSQSRAHAVGTIDDMPVLKRVLQAPPLYDTNSLMDEAYKPHKKFRAMRHRSGSEITTSSSKSDVSISPSPPAPHHHHNHHHHHHNNHHNNQDQQQQSQLHMHLTRPQQLQQQQLQQQQQQQQGVSSLSSTHSVLAKSLMEEPRMTPEQMKRQDIIQNYICGKYNQRNNAVAAAAAAGGSSGVTTSTSSSNGNNHYKVSSPAQSLLSTVLQAPSMRLSPGPLVDKKWHDNKYGIVITTTMANEQSSLSSLSSSLSPTPTTTNIQTIQQQTPQCTIAVKVAISTNDTTDKLLMKTTREDGAGTQPLNLSKKTLQMSPTQNTATSTTQQHVIVDDEKQQQQQVHKILLEA